jgi:hypothetical protein
VVVVQELLVRVVQVPRIKMVVAMEALVVARTLALVVLVTRLVLVAQYVSFGEQIDRSHRLTQGMFNNESVY